MAVIKSYSRRLPKDRENVLILGVMSHEIEKVNSWCALLDSVPDLFWRGFGLPVLINLKEKSKLRESD